MWLYPDDCCWYPQDSIWCATVWHRRHDAGISLCDLPSCRPRSPMSLEDWELDAFSSLAPPAAASPPSSHALTSIQQLLRAHVSTLQEELDGIRATLEATLDPVPSRLIVLLTQTKDSIDGLLARSDANCVSVLVSGALNAGKSTLLNAIIGALVCPTDQMAATTSLLTIKGRPSAELDDDVCRLRLAASNDLLEVGSFACIYRRLETIIDMMRADFADADRLESELVLEVPPSLPTFAPGPLAVELVDSPGANEALSPYLSDRWLAALIRSDVLVVVLAYDQLQTNDVAQFWRRLATELPSSASAKNLLVFLNKYDNELDDAALTLLRESCRHAILEYTNGRMAISPEQIYVGSARSALVAQIAARLDRDMPTLMFQEEYAELCPLAAQVVGGRRTRVPESAAALLDMDEWDAVLEESGFPQFERAFQNKTRISVLVHVYKLLTTVEAAATRFRGLCDDYVTPLRGLLDDASLSIERVWVAQQSIDTYFEDEAEPRDTVLVQTAITQGQRDWLDTIRRLVPTATATVLDTLPRSFAANNERELAAVLDAFHAAVEEPLAQATEQYKSRMNSLLGERQALIVSSFAEIQHILTTLGIALPEGMRPRTPTVENSTTSHEFLTGLNTWLVDVIDLRPAQLLQTVRQVVRLRVEPGSVFAATHDFSTGTSSADIQSLRGHLPGQGHAKLGHRMTLSMSVTVSDPFIGESFVLELEHLASDAGSASRAPVTVCVNGHEIRRNFCPRAMHERNNNKDGLWHYAKDRWHVESSYLRAGTNTVTIAYGDSGISYYWLRRLGLHCTLAPTSTEELHTRDIKTIFDASIVERMQLSEDQTQMLDRVLQETSPIRVLRETCIEYVNALSRLADSHDDKCVRLLGTIDAYAAAVTQCDALMAGCGDLINRVARVSSA